MDYHRQISDLQGVAKTKGYEVLEVFQEKVTGIKKSKDRPVLQRLLKLANEKAFETLFVSEVMRLGRNTREVINVIEDLTEMGINIYIHTYNIETLVNGKRNPSAQLITTLLAEVGRIEREHLIERTKSGLEQAKRNGKTLGRPGGTIKSKFQLLEEYKGIVKSLRKGLSIREAAKVNDVAINTVMKVKKAI